MKAIEVKAKHGTAMSLNQRSIIDAFTSPKRWPASAAMWLKEALAVGTVPGCHIVVRVVIGAQSGECDNKCCWLAPPY